MSKLQLFFKLVSCLNKLDLNDDGINAWLLDSREEMQIVIMHFLKDFSSAEFHINNCSQWGIIVEGEMTLWTNKKQVLKKGDMFFIPKSMPHRVSIKHGYKDITIFNGQRYQKEAGHVLAHRIILKKIELRRLK